MDHLKTTPGHRRRRPTGRRPLGVLVVSLLLGAASVLATSANAEVGTLSVPFPVQSLNGSGNNVANPTWGQGNLPYSRVATTRYVDGRSQPFGGPNSRAVSNRVFNDVHQNLFSETNVTQWGFTWGQFLDHTFGLRLGRAPNDPNGEVANIPFNPNDPLEEFTNTLGVIPFERSAPAPGTGVSNPRQQINTVGSYIEASAVYGDDNARLDWIREGSVDGNPANNNARVLLPGDYLPRRDSRGNPTAAPIMEVNGHLLANPNRATVAGDVRANENIALTATHTLFAREHNRIVSLLPTSLSQEDRFQIARRIVIAEQQFITYNEFLPSVGVNLPAYTGYKSTVDATLSNEFATVGYRAHSMIHGELETETEIARYTPEDLEALEDAGVEVEVDGDDAEVIVPLNAAFFNPDLVQLIQLGPLLKGLGGEPQYNNDEQIDNQLRSVLFQVPVPGNPDCLDGPTLPECFEGVVDLGAIDIERGRDHGIPTYNQLRQAYGLPAKTSFTSITGEATDQFPAGSGVDNPNSLDFVQLFNFGNQPVELGSPDAEGTGTRGVRRSTAAARLRAVYGSVNSIDAFTGVVAERHVPGTNMGELQLAIWRKQFQALRDGDRYFYGNDQGLSFIKNTYGIDFRRSLGDIIASNTDIPRDEMNDNVFLANDADIVSAPCKVTYTAFAPFSGNGYEASIFITNLRPQSINGWTLRWTFPSGQVVTQSWDGITTTTGANVAVRNASYNPIIGGNGGQLQFGFNATFDTATNPEPAAFTLNNVPCVTG